VLDAAVEDVPVEGGLELRAVVGLDHLDPEGQLLEQVVDELDGGLLVEVVLDPKHAEPGAVVDRCELVVLSLGAADRCDELDVDLAPMTGLSRPVLVEMCSSSHCSTARTNVGFPPIAVSANGPASSPSRRIGVSHPPTDLRRRDHHLNRFADESIEITVSIQLSGYFHHDHD
jgi:hypothetical protein